MPLVFVHGVANRMGDAYQRGVATRNALFRRFLLSAHSRSDGQEPVILSPYWGDKGGRLHWDGASLPLEDFENLGVAENLPLVNLYATACPDGEVNEANRAVLDVAHRSLPEAVDLLWGVGALEHGNTKEGSDALAALGMQAWRYAQANPHPAWLDEVPNDQALIDRLAQEVEAYEPVAASGLTKPQEWESLGIGDAWNTLRLAAGRLAAVVSGFVGREASDRVRPAVIYSLANFLGDIFVYLHQHGGGESAIADVVEEQLRAAAELRTDTDPLVIVAHSMGGNISYDLLTSSCSDLPVELYVTVGSQVGFFEELKLFRSSSRDIPGHTPKVPRPANVRRWINVFDYSDVLGFEAGSIFEGVEDYAYGTGSLLKAHSQYFLQPGFHERLSRRIQGQS